MVYKNTSINIEKNIKIEFRIENIYSLEQRKSNLGELTQKL